MSLSKAVKPTLVVMLSRFPYPLEKGDKLRAYHQIVGLSTKFNILLFCLSDHKVKEEYKNALLPFCNEIYVFKLNKLYQILSLGFCLFTEKPFQIAYFWQFHIHKKINKIIQAKKPDYIFSQLIRTTEYVKNYHACPKILDYMDAFSKGIERRMNEQNWFSKILFKQEYIRLKNYERYIYEYFEEHLIISEQDRNYILHNKSDEISIIKNGVSQYFLDINKKNTKTHDLIFTGNLSYPPNVAASLYIINNILPLLNNKINILISGVNPHPSIKKLASSKIELTGWIEDISESYLKSKVFVAPMFLGTGLQNKLLEAMALGIPCITTTMANTALGAIPEESVLIANNELEFKLQIERLLNDEILYKKIMENAYNFVNIHFNWKRINEQLADLIVNSKNKMLV